MSWDQTARESSLAKRRQLSVAGKALKKGQAELLVSTEGLAVVASNGDTLFSSGPDGRIQERLERYVKIGARKAAAFTVEGPLPGGFYNVTDNATGEVTRVKGKANLEALIG